MPGSAESEIISFAADDGFPLTFERYRPVGEACPTPLIVVHGAGVRAKLFSPPNKTTLVDCLLGDGYDVWLLNWRASIDLPPNLWTLDDAAVFDYPAAVRTMLEYTGATEVKAIIHCQGSTSFMMSITAGLLPEVSLVIANAVTLHPVVPWRSLMKSRYLTRSVGHLIPYLNPQWGLSAPAGWPSLIDWMVRATHHECNNPVCKHASFTYGSAFPTLWRHENLNDQTHEWLKGEFAHVPMTFFRQMGRCIDAGHLVSCGQHGDKLPDSVVSAAPRTEARFVLLAGEENNCFAAESQAQTFDYLEAHHPGRHALYPLAGYGHLDVFIGQHAATDVFPLIMDELSRG